MPIWYTFTDHPKVQAYAQAGRTLREARARAELPDRKDRQRGRLRRLGEQAYEYVSPGTAARGERVYVFTERGANVIRCPNIPVQRLLPMTARFDRRLLRKELRAL